MSSFNTNKNLLFFAGIYILVNMISAFFTPLIDDEAYYWAWSQKLAIGYFDHPPMVAFWASLGFNIFQNELGVRLITILFGGLGYFLLGKMLNLKNKSEFTLYSSLFFSTVLFAAFGFITTPDSPLLFFGILYIYMLKAFLEKSDLKNALLLGLVMALLLYSKYHGILLIIFSLLPISLKLVKNKYFYIAVVFGILCYAPHLWWQYDNNFVSAEYHIVRRNVFNHFKVSNTTDYLLSLIWASSPLLFYHNIKAIFKTTYNTDFKKALLGSFVGIIGFFILVTLKRYIQGQWSLLAFIPFIIISFHYYQNNLKAIGIMKKLAFITFGLMLIARVYFAYQDVPYKTQYHGWKDFMQRAGETTEGMAVFQKYQYTSLYNFYNYPNKQARNYITMENRNSQYELWNSEADLNGKDITFFSKYIRSTDSIIAHSRKDAIFKFKKIKNFQTAVNLALEVSNFIKKGNSFTAEMQITNHGNFPVDGSPENGFHLKQTYIEYPYSEAIKCVQDVQYDSFKIEPNASLKINIRGEICKQEPFDYLTYFDFTNKGMFPKNKSNYIDVKIETP